MNPRLGSAMVIQFLMLLFIGFQGHASEVMTPVSSNYNDPLPTDESGRNVYLRTVEECGAERQKCCVPARVGGRSLCGMAVGNIVACVMKKLGRDLTNCNCGAADLHASCEAGAKKCCGNGNDYVNCDNGALAKCGFSRGWNKAGTAADGGKGDPKVCDMPGAIRAYKHTPTAMGKKYGHVEYVCGKKKYCSIYTGALDHSWPREQEPDACWIPDRSLSNYLNAIDSSGK